MAATRFHALLLLILATIAAVGGWLFIGTHNHAHATTLRFWNGFTGPDGRTMLSLIHDFNAENPDIEVVMQRMDWGTYYNKLFVASMGGRAPELFIVHASSLPRFARAGLLSPLPDAAEHLPLNDIDPNVWHAMHYRKEAYAAPLDIHLLGMFYNTDLLEQAGIPPPQNREQFLSALWALKRQRTDGTQQWGFVFASYRNNLLALMAQFGGHLLSPDGKECLLDSPENVAALEFCTELVRHELVPRPENFDAWIGFRQGKVAIAFEGIYLLSDIEKQKELKIGAATLPVLGETAATWADSHGLCLRNDLPPAQRAAAWRFIRYLSDNSLKWAAAGQIPVRISLRNTPEFAAMRIQSAFAKGIPTAHYSPRVPIIFEFFAEFDLAIERAMRGSMEPLQALQIATKRINEAIARDEKDNASAALSAK